MPLVNCKVELSLNWTENCILTLNPNANYNINEATFTITNAKLYVTLCYNCYFIITRQCKIIKIVKRRI